MSDTLLKAVLVSILFSYIRESVLYLLFSPPSNSVRKYYIHHPQFGERELRPSKVKIFVQDHITLK